MLSLFKDSSFVETEDKQVTEVKFKLFVGEGRSGGQAHTAASSSAVIEFAFLISKPVCGSKGDLRGMERRDYWLGS